jgi:hypothetical protein
MPTLDEIARTFPGVRVFRLADDGRHAYCSEQGAFLGRGTPLLERAVDGAGRARFRPRDPSALARILRIGYGREVETSFLMSRLGAVASALEKGDLALANILLVHARIDPLPDEDAALRLAKADRSLRRALGERPRLRRSNPDWADEARQPQGVLEGGQWTTGGDDGLAETTDDEQIAQTDPRHRAAQDEVARAAIAASLANTKRNGVPYGGLIYQNSDGTFHANPARPGTSNGVDPYQAYPDVPANARVVASYRTSIPTFLTDPTEAETLTPDDAARSKVQLDGVYVGTSNGRLLFFDYATQTPITDLGRIKP